jgi:phosphoglucomutase
LYRALAAELGEPVYERTDAPATRAQKAKLGRLTREQVRASTLADEKIEAIFTHAPGGGNPIGGLKVVTKNGWLAGPSGTEDVYKIYAESFLGTEHLRQVQTEVRALVTSVIG